MKVITKARRSAIPARLMAAARLPSLAATDDAKDAPKARPSANVAKRLPRSSRQLKRLLRTLDEVEGNMMAIGTVHPFPPQGETADRGVRSARYGSLKWKVPR